MNEKIDPKEYWEQIDFYSELAVEKSKDHIERLNELIKNLDNLVRPSFEKLLSYLSSEKIVKLSDDIKVNLWDGLVDFTSKHKRFSDAKWALPPDVISKIDLVASQIKPKNPLFLYARLFSSRDIDLYKEKGNWEEQYKKLDEQRQKAIKEILKEGEIDTVYNFLENVDSQSNVGNTLGSIADDSIDKKILPKSLDTEDSKIKQFISAYVWSKHYNKGWNWVDEVINSTWSNTQIACFFTFLPFTLETWKRVREKLSEFENLYWLNVNVNPYQTRNDLTIAIEKLLEVGRPKAAIYCIYKDLFDKKPLKIPTTLYALKAGINSQEPNYSMHNYHVIEIIKALQSNPEINEKDLLDIEWIYLSFFDEHIGVSPSTLEFGLASYPNFFSEVIQMIYRSKKISEEERKEPTNQEKAIAINALNLLDKWEIPPGKQKDNSFNEKEFKKWIDQVKEICRESGHLEVALLHAGKVLFYSPKDPSGFWINKIVAEELNRMDADKLRSGFSNEVFNSIGFHFIDPSGKSERGLAQGYKNRAEETENEGFHRLAVTLRKISESFEREATYIIDEHKKDMQDLE